MNVSSEHSVSLWMKTSVVDDAPALDRDEKADVVIVGSGIAGMSVAYELARAGKDVVIIDRGPIGKGMTSRTTAHLTAQCDDGFDQLISRRGEETAKLWYQSQAACLDRIEANQKELRIACDFRRLDGHLFHAPGTDPGIIDREYEATKKIGMPIKREKGVPFNTHEKTPSLLYPNQATFHPLKYLAGLAASIRKAGGRFYADTTVKQVEEDENGVEVKAGRHTVRANHAVVATNSPINDKYAIHTKQAPYRTYAMAFFLPKGSLPDGLYWDTLEAYHYVRLQPGTGKNDFLIVGGADHKSGEADDADARFLALESWMRNLLPDLGKEKHRWSGQIQETIDYCGFIGRNPGEKRTFLATGDSGQGITRGAVAGMLISDLILKGSSPWLEVYDPARKPVKATGTFVSENLTVAKNFAEYVAPGELSSWDELKPGQGAIVRKGVSKVAAYRDENGKLLLRSAACTHLGCHLHWNSFERCWDCPCHGSQFAPDGSALNGPLVLNTGQHPRSPLLERLSCRFGDDGESAARKRVRPASPACSWPAMSRATCSSPSSRQPRAPEPRSPSTGSSLKSTTACSGTWAAATSLKNAMSTQKFSWSFAEIGKHTSGFAGSSIAFAGACGVILLWAITGPLFGLSDTWQLIINSGTTIVTFVMVFLLQNTQNRDARALHLKLDELLRSLDAARSRLINHENCTDEEIEQIERQFRALKTRQERQVRSAIATPGG